jgi:ATP-dependent helicase/nuclease subunit A
MSSVATRPAAPDQPQRESALHPARSILVQAPAGSGKTDLLTRRYLRLLAAVDSPDQIVAITFTNAAAAEMRHRILAELEKATKIDASSSSGESSAESLDSRASEAADADEFSMDVLARRALVRSRAIGWNITELPAQLRILTIDAFCRELALQQPLLSGLGGGLDIHEQPRELYRRAARHALEQIDGADSELQSAIRDLLLWRDNDWQQLENLLVAMLSNRHRWMHYFVLNRRQDWGEVRERLERPFGNAVRQCLTTVDMLLDRVPNGRQEALELARFACAKSESKLHRALAELAEFPAPPFALSDALEAAREAYLCVGNLVLTKDGYRQRVDKRHGFPADCKAEKNRLFQLIANMQAVPGLESALLELAALPPARFTEEDWQIVRASFMLLRAAAAQLKVVFAETGAVDFIEVAQIAEAVLRGEDNLPTDAAIDVADGIRHLLVDEFQDTSRRQHQLLAGLIAAWSEREGRTCFLVGDPMQSIYFFRDADAELFARIRDYGLQLAGGEEPLRFDHVPLTSNFRTAPPLVRRLNGLFAQIFALDDGSGIAFSPAEPARASESIFTTPFALHVSFIPQSVVGKPASLAEADEREAARQAQIREIVDLVLNHLPQIERTRAENEKLPDQEKKKHRVAVLGRTRSALSPIAEALRNAGVPFRAVDLENLRDRPEVLDALALARALLNPHDRLAWLGVLRAPWCGLALADLHTLTSADDATILGRPVPELLGEHAHLLSDEGRLAIERVLSAIEAAPLLRFTRPTASLGVWLEQVWIRLGGELCADAAQRANLELLWRCLDALPNREEDLLGPALDAALSGLTALPDPGASSDCGVQLMTIHKSKGLEFEVVLVPELQAHERASSFKMLSWLERGLSEPDDSGEVTEFLVAPFQPKGADRGGAKAWVDRVYREREKQEARRLLYVAATRAREELHFFARPNYRALSDGSLQLIEPSGTLLATLWPALESEISERFQAWQATRAVPEPQPATIESLAASSDESNLLVMPSPGKPTLLRRLAPEYRVPPAGGAEVRAPNSIAGDSASQLYARHEGGLLSRALGEAVHLLLENLARLRASLDWDSARDALQRLQPRVAAELRAMGLSGIQAGSVASRAMHHALDAATDPDGAWILSPHPQAASEVRWAGVLGGELRMVRVDRVFQSGSTPHSEGDPCWWIIDYKTAHPEGLTPGVALPNLRRLFAAQLETYAEVLRNLHPDGRPIRAALYYPLMRALDWWEVIL